MAEWGTLQSTDRNAQSSATQEPLWILCLLCYLLFQSHRSSQAGTMQFESHAKPAKGAKGEVISLGRVGSTTLDKDLEGAMAEPFTYDAGNVDKFAKIF